MTVKFFSLPESPFWSVIANAVETSHRTAGEEEGIQFAPCNVRYFPSLCFPLCIVLSLA